MDRAEVLAQMRGGREQLEAALAEVDDGKMEKVGLYGAWSVKDLVAHLGYWEQRVAGIYHALLAGGTPDLGEASMDEVNATVFKMNHELPLAAVRRQEQAAYRTVLALVETARPEDLFDPQRFAWTGGQPFVGWIDGNTYGHYAEHLPELLAWIDRS